VNATCCVLPVDEVSPLLLLAIFLELKKIKNPAYWVHFSFY
jgi:hypothetical protein